jgi:hypothetical protein
MVAVMHGARCNASFGPRMMDGQDGRSVGRSVLGPWAKTGITAIWEALQLQRIRLENQQLQNTVLVPGTTTTRLLMSFRSLQYSLAVVRLQSPPCGISLLSTNKTQQLMRTTCVLRNEFLFTISNYKSPINPVHMRLDRLIVVHDKILSSFSLETMKATPQSLVLRWAHWEWIYLAAHSALNYMFL